MSLKVKSIIKKAVNSCLGRFGLMIVKKKRDFSMLSALMNIRERGYEPATIIDVGASNGKWSEVTQSVFPRSKFLLFEPLDENVHDINRLVDIHANWTLSKKVAGNSLGDIQFNVKDDIDGSSVLFDEHNSENIRTYEMTTIDAEVKKYNLKPPFLVKLDTHGFELPIIEGMKEIWDGTEFLIIETYNFKLHSECALFFEMAYFLKERGFYLLDIVDLSRRPGDKVLWQMDMVFGKKSQNEFKKRKYR